MPPKSAAAPPEALKVIDSNVLELPSKKQKKKVVEEVKKKKPLTKSQQRKLKRMLEEKAMASKRAHAYEVLAQQQLSDTHRALLDSSARMGQKDTMKQKLKLAFLRQKAGIQTEEDRQLLEVERPVEDAMDAAAFHTLIAKERAVTPALPVPTATTLASEVPLSKKESKKKRKAAQRELEELKQSGDSNLSTPKQPQPQSQPAAATSFFDAVLTQITPSSAPSQASSLAKATLPAASAAPATPSASTQPISSTSSVRSLKKKRNATQALAPTATLPQSPVPVSPTQSVNSVSHTQPTSVSKQSQKKHKGTETSIPSSVPPSTPTISVAPQIDSIFQSLPSSKKQKAKQPSLSAQLSELAKQSASKPQSSLKAPLSPSRASISQLKGKSPVGKPQPSPIVADSDEEANNGDVDDEGDEGDEGEEGDNEEEEEESRPRVRDPKPGRWMGSGVKEDGGPKGAYSVGFKVWGAKQRKRAPFLLPGQTLAEATAIPASAPAPSSSSSSSSSSLLSPLHSSPSFTPTAAQISQEQNLYQSLLAEAEPTPLASTTCVVHVNRDPEMAKTRMQLPIYSQEQEIIELVRYNDVSIICGETGSGKTTQVPQFLLENGYSKARDTPEFQARSVLVPPYPGMIGVTQPRRVAAVSTANRIARELNLGSRASNDQLDCLEPQLAPTLVAYQIRYDSKADEQTRIKLMTDGILLKEIQADFLLQKYSVLILDEAHERGINTDVLIGLLSRIVVLRRKKAIEYDTTKEGEMVFPLKLVIMSATLRVDDFVSNIRLFPLTRPPVLDIPARQFKVVDHFSRRTPVTLGEATEKTFSKICQAHMRLPQGGILVFLTGRHEIEVLCRRLRETFQAKAPVEKGQQQQTPQPKVTETADVVLEEEVADDDALDTDSEDEAEVQQTESNGKFSRELAEFLKNDQRSNVCVLPLYSILPTHQQLKVFQPVAPGHRLIVVSTNVAETSLTIPGIKYVIDTGREKTRVYDKVTGTSRFEVTWISKASARQRSGRAGRTAPGHCYRLYSGAVFAEFSDHTVPEILRTPIEDVVLQMKHMSIDNVASFPFPTPPDDESLRLALLTLKILGAIDNSTEKITELGKSLAQFPLSPRLGKMLLLAHQGGCVPFVIAIVASLSVNELWSSPAPITDKDSNENAPDSKQPGTDAKVPEEDSESGGHANEEDDNDDDETAKQKLLKAKRRAQSLAYNEARQRWGHDRSDLLTNLRVFGGFLFCTGKQKNVALRLAKQLEFCEKNFVRHKALLEMESLAKQLSRIARQLGESALQDQEHLREEDGGETEIDSYDFQMQVPSVEQEQLLCQIVCTGFIDRVCRQMPEYEKSRIIKSQPEWDDKLHGAYQSIAMPSTPVFIHPGSQLFPRSAQPEWLCYHELIATSAKHYLRGVTAIAADWIADLAGLTCPLVERSKPLENPLPRFDSKRDCVMATAKTSFGFPGKGRRWFMPLSEIVHPPGPACEKHFARLLLQGDVLPPLKEFRVYLLSRPTDLFQPILPKKAVTLLQSLRCSSRKQMLSKSREDLERVRDEVCKWLQPSIRNQLKERWASICSLSS